MRGPSLSSACLLAALTATAAPASVAPPQAFRILVDTAGVYRLTFAELQAAGFSGEGVDASALALTWRGSSVPLWVRDGGDGVLGPGDAVEFVGDVAHGVNSHFSPHTRANAYRLTTAGIPPAPTHQSQARPAARGSAAADLSTTVHLEEDRLLVRLSPAQVATDEVEPELWFWHKLSHADREPLALALDLPGLATESVAQTRLRVGARALSRPRDKPAAMRDHRLDVRVNGRRAFVEEWDGTEARIIELPELAAVEPRPLGNELAFRVLRQRPEADGDPLVDVVMLNWIEVRYPHSGAVDQATLLAVDAETGSGLELSTQSSGLVAYGEAGTRLEWPEGLVGARVAAPADRSLWVVPAGGLLSPLAVEEDSPSDLRTGDHQADYLMVAHHSLLEASRPLAEFHRRRGLSVELIDVQDVYDEFHGGIVDPRAIRDFVAHAFHHWRPPAPRYLLLVGDASWDVHSATPEGARYADWAERNLERGGDGFSDPRRYAVATEQGAARQLIPTWTTITHEGHAAADGWFAAVDGDDFLPDLAIGRLPVTRPEEVEAIVAKSIAYVRDSGLGPWRHRLLLVTNEWDAYQRRSDGVARRVATAGISSRKVYPTPDEADNLAHQQSLVDALSDGSALVHFLGHGGRFIWRTGPPDLEKNHDLFTLDHVDRLRPAARLPVILSLTCFSAPFDHPSADSIGEKFLRVAGKGAVAVVGASWRSNPGEPLSRLALDVFGRPGTIGEAFLAFKRQITDRALNEGYNLLGDPALPLALPAHTLPLALETTARERRVRGTLPASGFAGRLAVDWYDERATVLQSDEVQVTGQTFVLEVPENPAVAGVSIYAWDAAAGVDAAGGLDLAAAAP